MKANHSTTKEINEPIEKHMSCAGIRSFMNSSKVKGLSSQLLLWKFQYKAELSCDWLTARQWWHTWIPVQLVRSKRNIFLCQLQSPLISVNLHLGSGFPASRARWSGSGWSYWSRCGCNPSCKEFRLHVIRRKTVFIVLWFQSGCSGMQKRKKRLILTDCGFHKTRLKNIPTIFTLLNLVNTRAESPYIPTGWVSTLTPRAHSCPNAAAWFQYWASSPLEMCSPAFSTRKVTTECGSTMGHVSIRHFSVPVSKSSYFTGILIFSKTFFKRSCQNSESQLFRENDHIKRKTPCTKKYKNHIIRFKVRVHL